MKKIKIFSLAVMALLAAACSNSDMEDSTQPVVQKQKSSIPFKATITLANEASTRGLSEEGNNLKATWAVDDEVALIYNGIVDVLKVLTVDPATGNADISGELTGTLGSETKVDVIYPASAVDKETKALKAGLLTNQDGSFATIAKNLDVRKATGNIIMIEVGDDKYASFDKGLALANEYAIVKFSLTDGTNALNATSFVIKDANDKIITTVTPAAASNELYAVLPSSSEESKYKFDAKIGNDLYLIEKTAKIESGKYYQSNLKLANIVKFIRINPETGKKEEVAISDMNYTIATTETKVMENSTYIINNNTDMSNHITIRGEVNLILKDGVTLYAKDGIAGNDYTLNIYGEEEGTGTIIVDTHQIVGYTTAAITMKYLNVYGGRIIANSRLEPRVHGIEVTVNCKIYGGYIEAYGGPGVSYGDSKNGLSAISVRNDLYIMGGEVKAYGGNPGSVFTSVNGTYAIFCNGMHVSNKDGNFIGFYGEGGKGIYGGRDGHALNDFWLYYDNTIDISSGNDLNSMDQFDTSSAVKETRIKTRDFGKYIKITPAAAP